MMHPYLSASCPPRKKALVSVDEIEQDTQLMIASVPNREKSYRMDRKIEDKIKNEALLNDHCIVEKCCICYRTGKYIEDTI